ncbi:hypothetical protein JVT61DRAFT_663 [Boletus reticuloceps]|uniref:Uncharacterized protein n=1 Tax=Boletus reticuloceps TaxID=495285 RepID=A0A8I2Z051_9AGAM|nr:hypothetical protein JVT61DRAFT_663 [Boletus reticuloceps]
MTSRTPIRLTPHRGPLATPSTSPESSPTLSTPPTDISYCSTPVRPALDIAILQHRIFTLSPPMQQQYGSRLHRRRHEITTRGLFGRNAHLSPLSIFESLLYSANELAKTVAGIVTFFLVCIRVNSTTKCLDNNVTIPPSTPTRALRCHVNPYSCEPSDQHAAVLQFLSEQIQHAKALSSLSVGLGLPLRAFLETHRATIPRVVVRHNLSELPHLVQEVDTLANLTEFLDPSLLDFTSGSFIGRSFTLALEELGDLITDPMTSHASSTHREHQDAHLHAIYWRTASNLLLEYSAARPRVRRLLQHLRVVYQELSPSALGHHVAGGIEEKLNIWWWKGIIRHRATSVEDGIQAFVAGLEVTLDNVHRLTAYLDWITEQLAQTTLRDVLKTRHRTDFSSFQAFDIEATLLLPERPRGCASHPTRKGWDRGSRQSDSARGSLTLWTYAILCFILTLEYIINCSPK